ncbi:hypothetical protein DdX_14681 [Ditylenchus destructor]|uniref:HD domain-containing protein n=1 Tax=Ditylenchus destructor TaxID=166010 RepID=A0AAD4QYC8_9BILA|nr:hypothetical protein DdX_14681 [Ditylenchus destructor]
MLSTSTTQLTYPDRQHTCDAYDEKFVEAALKGHEEVIKSGALYEDGSSLKEVVEQGHVVFDRLEDGTKADYVYQCALFQQDIEQNLSSRLIGLLRKLEGDHIKRGTGAKVDLFEHSLQTASRAYRDRADEEMVVVALLHDIGEMMSPMNDGEVAGAILKPYVSPEAYWILTHHEIFQGYYYFHHVGGNRDTRDIYKDHPNYQTTVDFCHNWDQPSFDPEYESFPISHFEPMLKHILQRKPYWHFPNQSSRFETREKWHLREIF